ncbi:transcription factor BHLH42 [Macadamia integrifolia]|uniref:transcription factor BHLH42 n=1 Tax=Macadamia integrifolia TaxID=60698 RepID=UPI001C4EA546|nr:transcription factor BHLH42 [Macadamia integrifolia]
MATLPGSRLQQMLQSAVQAIQWTYSLFWQVCPQQGILVWGDGYYNGPIKTRKTVQPMEVSAEEASLQRSEQLRELYESLSAGETNQPARRPCAALSPEDLTESEWFYLMCVSFSFPPGVGLPGKAFTRRQHVWLTGANEADSKSFSRAILAKSARIQTVVCIPLMDGVVEFGTTERVQEDLGLIQRVKSFFLDQHHHHHHHHHHNPKPALSEHSTSNPASSSDRPRFHSPPLPAMYSAQEEDPVPATTNQGDDDIEDVDEEEEEEEEEEEAAESDSETDTGRNSSPPNASTQEQIRLCEPINQGVGVSALAPVAQVAAEPSELMQLEMSEDIRLGSPDDASNNLDSDLHILAGSGGGGQPDHHHHHHHHQQRRADSFKAESTRRWPPLPDTLNVLQSQPPHSATPQMEELTQEDTHYSQTVSTILQQNPTRWSESYMAFGYSQQSAFSKWNSRNDHLLHLPLEGTSQWLLKYILFSVPFLHIKYRDENSPKSSRDADTATRFRKVTPQDELSANHVLAERRRREKLNERFIILRSLVPFVTKMDKASILGDTIEYVKQLRRRIQDLESRNRQMEVDQRSSRGAEPQKSGGSKDQQQRSGPGSSGVTAVQERTRGLPGSDKKKLRIVETTGGTKAKVLDPVPIVGTTVQVSIIEADALLELQCTYRENLLLEIMQILRELRFEITAVQSSSTNGIFNAELRAKVKDHSSGRKPSIVEVKRTIHQIIAQSRTSSTDL